MYLCTLYIQIYIKIKVNENENRSGLFFFSLEFFGQLSHWGLYYVNKKQKEYLLQKKKSC